MAQYSRTTTIDVNPGGDSGKQGFIDLDADLTGIVAAYNAHDTATTTVHGFTGTKTGSGAMVGATSPTLVTPTLGVATATSINKVTITQPATAATLTIADGASLITAGAFAVTLTATAATGVTLPTSGTLVSSVATGNGVSATNTAGALAFTLGVITPTSVNGLTLAAAATGFTVAGGTTSKTLTVSNTLTLAGTDSSTLNIGTGGTLGTAAFTAATAYEASGGISSHAALITGVHGLVFTAGKTLTLTNILTFSGTDSTTMTFPTTSATIARTDAANTFTGHQTIEGVTSTGATGTGNLVFSASPTFTGTVTIPTPFTLGNGTAPTAVIADGIQMWSADYAAGDARLYIMGEKSTEKVIIGDGGIVLGDAGKLTLDIAPASNLTATGIVSTETISGTTAVTSLLYRKSDSTWALTDADAAATMPGLKMALEVKTNAACIVLDRGVVRNDAWAWTVGGLIYASTDAGGLTQTALSGDGDQVQIVGYALTATVMVFDPSPVFMEISLAIEVKNTGYAITWTGLTAIPKVFTCDHASDQVFTFAAPTAADVGKQFWIVKSGTDAGKWTVDAPTGVVLVDGASVSADGGTIACTAAMAQSALFMCVSTTKVVVLSANATLIVT